MSENKSTPGLADLTPEELKNIDEYVIDIWHMLRAITHHIEAHGQQLHLTCNIDLGKYLQTLI